MSAQQDPEAVVLVEQREPFPVRSIRGPARIAQLAEAQGERLHELWNALRSRRVTPTGPPLVRYHAFGEIETDREIGVPVPSTWPAPAEWRTELVQPIGDAP